MSKTKPMVTKENAIQAVVVADTFEDEFVPITNDIALSLFPLVNKPLIDYTLEFLSIGGIEETFLFCCNHVAEVKAYLNQCIQDAVGWTLTMKVQIIVSESCRSFGDCLRDLDAKGLLRGDFVLLEPGVISNIYLLPLLKKHSDTCQSDKGAAMTLIFQECGLAHRSLCPQDETLIAINNKNRILFHKKPRKTGDRRVEFPLEIFLENASLSIHHNIKDTHIAICSSSVLPLFSDNFDFQTRDDFIRGLLMNEEIMGSTVYCNILKGSDYGGAVLNWRSYQALSLELNNKWIHPLIPSSKRNRHVQEDSTVSASAKLSQTCHLERSIIGPNVTIGNNVKILDSFIFENAHIEDDAVVSLSVIGSNSLVKKGAKVTAGTVLGKGVIIEENLLVENSLVQAKDPEDGLKEDKLGHNAYRLRADEDEEDLNIDKLLAGRLSRLHIHEDLYESEYESENDFSESEDELSHTNSPPPDDTKLFFSEVIDSLTRGYEDKLLCDNLILEINSSRYAYNVTVKEVNFNVIKAILIMSHKIPDGPQYFNGFSQLLAYFAPILKNYIKNESAMADCLQAIEDVSINSDLKDKWAVFSLKYLYEKDYLTEEAILKWFSKVEKNTKFHSQVKPFADWLQEAEEEGSSEEESD
ncbi:translation initiation factor eIF-2B subunit epsilon isoform X2 [Anthonomus grandis grandis]|uniref:translation initiation factor eIF-2B subunit epsilon isoform X2 n=1 Tax=Anthonomus grandis grandis TaxID=2921223 RepID=UPI002165A199|nr:translation initiation factor eIF-2B subunit epsilon isoform X2 [Anthonomus grandis grandis]